MGALKKYDQFVPNTSCFWGSTGSNSTPAVVQFHEFFVTKIMNKLNYYYCWSKKIREIAQLWSIIFFVTTNISRKQNLKTASTGSSITPEYCPDITPSITPSITPILKIFCFSSIERKWAPTMMKVDEDEPGTGTQHFFLEILRTKHGGNI